LLIGYRCCLEAFIDVIFIITMINIPRKHLNVQESTRNFLKQHDREHGCILDVGAGAKAQARKDLLKKANYVSVDIEQDNGISVMSDIHFLPFRESSFDAVICTQVLEHVKDPIRSCEELYRVIKSGGLVFVTLPFVWREHGCPFDFWRFTSYGCYRLLQDAGFSNIEIASNGGYFIVLDYILEKLGYRLFGQTIGRICAFLYKPVGAMFYYLDKLLPHNDCSINFAVTATKE
jgi:SAM-dependent methyltransferase